MGFGEALLPGWVGADCGVGRGMEVSVAGLVVVAEEDGGVETGRDFVEQILGAGEVVGSRAKVSAEEGGGPGFCAGWN